MAQLPNGPETTPHERSAAAAIHLAGIFAPLWVPALCWFAFRKSSRFIASHAWQEIVDGILWKALLLVAMLGSLAWTLIRLAHHIQTNWKEFTWQELALKAGVSLALMATLFVWNLIQAVLQAKKAHAGQWPKRELKKIAKRAGA